MTPLESNPDPREPLAAVFLDLAEQESRRGNLFIADTWRQAAAIASGFVPRPGPDRAPVTEEP